MERWKMKKTNMKQLETNEKHITGKWKHWKNVTWKNEKCTHENGKWKTLIKNTKLKHG